MANSAFIPDSWKINAIRPLFKTAGKPTIVSNYRPISNLNTLERIFEKSILTIFSNVVDGRLSSTQYGFARTSKISTTANLIDCYGSMNRIPDKRVPIDIISRLIYRKHLIE